MVNRTSGDQNKHEFFMKRVKNIKIIIISILAFIAIGLLTVYFISNEPKRKLEKQILALQGMPINLKFKTTQALFKGRDSTFVSEPVKKFVLFVDSTSCSKCFIGKLVEYFEVNDTLSSRNAQMVVILHPKIGVLPDVTHRLQNERFPFWCIVDKDGEFIQNNPSIPSNQLLHTFTLNEENNVILVGNPIRNKKLRSLLYRVLD